MRPGGDAQPGTPRCLLSAPAGLTGVKRLRHPVIGDLELPYEATSLADDSG
jgi:hypothetical protein